MSLAGRVIALAEGRQLEDLAQLLAKDHAAVIHCPMIGIRDNPDRDHVRTWLSELREGRFSIVVLMTGEGLRRLLGVAERDGRKEAVVQALGRCQVAVRGPKPIQALREIGLKPTWVAAKPTTDGLIETLQTVPLRGIHVGVQLYDRADDRLSRFIDGAGGFPHTVIPYVYAPAAETDQVVDLITKIAAGAVDAVIFTSAPQVERFFEVAAERHVAVDWSRTKVAAVGPVVAGALHRHGAPVHICPEQGYQMKNLVHHLRLAFGVS